MFLVHHVLLYSVIVLQLLRPTSLSAITLLLKMMMSKLLNVADDVRTIQIIIIIIIIFHPW